MKEENTRRGALKALAGFGIALVQCGTSGSSPNDGGGGEGGADAPADSASDASLDDAGSCKVTPNEIAGPYPDKVQQLRQDITEGRPGLALTLTFTVVNAKDGCKPMADVLVDIWQCDADGHYSEYLQPTYDGTGLSFLRGVQTTDANGQATFKTIYPGWYMGRAAHIHVEVRANGNRLKTSQIAFPDDVTAAVYATGVYATHGQNPTQNANDGSFADGVNDQLVSLVGDTTNGYAGTLVLGVSV